MTRRRARVSSGRTAECSKSKRSSILEDTLLTFCPPGPEERTAVQRSSSAGIVNELEMKRGEDMRRGHCRPSSWHCTGEHEKRYRDRRYSLANAPKMISS